MIRVGGMAEDALVLLVERVHRVPGKGHPVSEDRGVRGKRRVLPGTAGRLAVTVTDGIPGGGPELGVLGAAVARRQHVRLDVGTWEVRDRVAPRLVEQDNVVALRDPVARVQHAHAAAQRLGEQQPLRQWLRGEKGAKRTRCQWSLLPCQTHRLWSFRSFSLSRPAPARSFCRHQ